MANNVGVSFSQPYEKDGGVVIPVAHTITDKDIRVVAVGTDGKELSSSRTSMGSAGAMSQITSTFSNLSLKDIRAFRLQSRPYHWIEFRNVLLKPTGSDAESPEKTAKPKDSTAVFGPEIEKTLFEDRWLDVDSGFTIVMPPASLSERQSQVELLKNGSREVPPWMRQRGIDFFAYFNQLASVDVKSINLESDDWDKLTPEELQEKIRSLKPADPILFGFPVEESKYYGFQSREGATGILQFVGPLINYTGVKIRYKIILGTANSIPNTEKTVNLNTHPGSTAGMKQMPGEPTSTTTPKAIDEIDSGKLPAQKTNDPYALVIDQPDMVQGIALVKTEPMTWQWRVHLPKGHKYASKVAYGEIPAKGVPKATWTSISNEPYWETGVEAVLTAAIRKGNDGKWAITVDARSIDTKHQLGGGSTPVPDEEMRAILEIGNAAVTYFGDRGIKTQKPSDPVILFSKSNLSKLDESKKSVPGIMIWLEEYDAPQAAETKQPADPQSENAEKPASPQNPN